MPTKLGNYPALEDFETQDLDTSESYPALNDFFTGDSAASPEQTANDEVVNQFYKQRYQRFLDTGDVGEFVPREAILANAQPANPNAPNAVERGFSNLGDNINFGIAEDPEALASLVKTGKETPIEQQMFKERVGKESQDVADAEGVWDTLVESGEWVAAALSSPMELASYLGEQIPQQIPTLAAGFAGRWAAGKAGAAVGAMAGVAAGGAPAPLLSAIGFAIGAAGGGFAVDYISEKASNVIDAVKDPNDIEQLKAAVADTEILTKAENEALLHATGVAGTDLIITLLTAGVVRGGGLGRGLAGFGVESFGEGASEAAGQYLSKGVLDAKEIGLEVLGGAGQSAATAAILSPISTATTPALSDAQRQAQRIKDIDPNRGKDSLNVDYSNISNPYGKERGTSEVFENKDVAKAAYRMQKFTKEIQGILQADKAKDFVGPSQIPAPNRPGYTAAVKELEHLIKANLLSDNPNPATNLEVIDAARVVGMEGQVQKLVTDFQTEIVAEREAAAKEVEKVIGGEKKAKKVKAKDNAILKLDKLITDATDFGTDPIEDLTAPAEGLVAERIAANKETAKEKKMTAAQKKAAIKKMDDNIQAEAVVEPPVVEPTEAENTAERALAIKRAVKAAQGEVTEIAGETVTPDVAQPITFEPDTEITAEQIKETGIRALPGTRYMDVSPEGQQALQNKYGPDTTNIEKVLGAEQDAMTAEVAATAAEVGVSEKVLSTYRDAKVHGRLTNKSVKELRVIAKTLGVSTYSGGKTLNKAKLIEAINSFANSTPETQIGQAVTEAKNKPKDSGGRPVSVKDIVVNKPFKALKLDRKGNEQGPLWEPITRVNPLTGEKTVITNNVMLTDAGVWQVQLDNGTWVDSEKAGHWSQDKFSNNYSVQRSAPLPQEGDTVWNVKSKTHRELHEADVATKKKVDKEEKAAKPTKKEKAEAPTGKKPEVPFTEEELNYIFDQVKLARDNASNNVADNIKEQLDERFGEGRPFKEYQNLAMQWALNTIAPRSEGTVVPTPPERATPPQKVDPKRVEDAATRIASNEVQFAKTHDWSEVLIEAEDGDSYPVYQSEDGLWSNEEQDYVEFQSVPLEVRKQLLYDYTHIKQEVAVIAEENTAVKEAPVEKESVGPMDGELYSDNDTTEDINDYLEDGLADERPDEDTIRHFDDQPTHSVAETPARKRSRVAAVTRAVKKFYDKIQKNIPEVDLLVVTNSEDLKEFPHLQNYVFDEAGDRQPGRKNTSGLFIKKGWKGTKKPTVIIFADRFRTPDQAVKTIFHEIVGHYGIRMVLGDQWNNFLDKIINTNHKAAQAAFDLVPRWDAAYLDPTQKGIIDSRYLLHNGNLAISGVPRRKDGFVPVRDADGKLVYASPEFMSIMMDEYIAVEAEKFYTRDGSQSRKVVAFIKRVIAYTRHILRGYLGSDASKVTDNDIAAMLSISYRHIVEGDPISRVEAAAKREDVNINDRVRAINTELMEPEWRPNTFDPANHPDFITGTTAMASVPGYGGNNINNLNDKYKNDESQVGFIKAWRDGVERMSSAIRRTRLGKKLSTYEGANREAALDTLMRTTRGKIWAVNENSKKLFPWMSKLDSAALKKISDAWLNGVAFDTVPGLTIIQKAQLNKARADLEEAQTILNGIVDNTKTGEMILPDDKLERSKGKYLHTMFWKYMNEYAGTGKSPSMLNWMKKRVSNEEARVLMGEIKNPAMLIPKTVDLIARDAFLLRLLQDIVDNSDEHNTYWVLDSRKTFAVPMTSGTQRMSLTTMLSKIEEIEELLNKGIQNSFMTATQGDDVLRNNLKILQETYDAHKGERLAAVKQAMMESGYPYAKVTPDGTVTEVLREPTDEEAAERMKADYILVSPKNHPNLKPFHNKYVHKAIFTEFASDDPSFDFEVGGGVGGKVLRDMTNKGGWMEAGTGMWKQLKTGFNIPTYWIRNLIGNYYLLDTSSSTPTVQLSAMLGKEIRYMIPKYSQDAPKVGGRTYKEWAENFGLYATTYGATELYFLQQNYNDYIKKNKHKEDKNPFKAMGYDIKSSYVWFSEQVADKHGLLEGIFKQTAMKDYVTRWEKMNNTSVAKLMESGGERAVEGLMAAAAEHAESAIFDYQKVPLWVKRLRRTPLGTPFLTFNYKMATQLPKAMLKHPWKLGKYYAAPAMLGQALLGDMSEDDWEKIKEDMPWYLENHHSVMALPIKDANGRFQYYDFTYSFPPSLFVDGFAKIMSPGIGESSVGNAYNAVTSDIGFLGGPVPQALTAIIANQDPFTGRDIWEKGAPASANIDNLSMWVYNLVMPPVMTNTGLLGRTLNQAGIDAPLISTGQHLNKHGTDKETLGQTIWRGAGVGAGGFSPSESRVDNYKKYKFEESRIKAYRSKIMRDPNIGRPEKIKAAAESARRLKSLHQKYVGKSS